MKLAQEEMNTAMKDTILIVDDETDLLHGLQRTINMEMDCRVLIAENSIDAMEHLKSEPIDVVLSDICMPEMDGIDLLHAINDIDPFVTVIMMTAFGTVEMAVEAIKAGAYDFIQKPFDEERLIHLLEKGLELNRLVRENAHLIESVREKDPFENMVGKSEPMLKVFRTIQMLAKTDVTVLILGETGTGKDLAARAIHALSKRRHRGMVTVNCPALPENILESELFGYRKGAFTDATSDKKGLFEEADGSSIFLDEIGDLSLPLQTKLLRVLQEKEIRPLGDIYDHKVDVRIIASTNQNLEKKMKEGLFRDDLYYRLNVAKLTMPPLCEIKEDIPLLTEHLLKKAACELDVPAKKITPAAMNSFFEQDWHGNVRELENIIRGIMAIAQGDVIDTKDLPFNKNPVSFAADDLDITQPYKLLKERMIEEFSKKYVTNLLKKTSGNISLAARKSGICRQSLQKIINRYKIVAEKFRI